MWTLHAKEGQNIQLHFQDVALEASYDVLEVRDGADPNSELLGESVWNVNENRNEEFLNITALLLKPCMMKIMIYGKKYKISENSSDIFKL